MKSTPQSISIRPLSEQRIDKLPVIVKLAEGGYFKDPTYPRVLEKAQIVADWTDNDVELIKQITAEDIDNLYKTIIKLLNEFKPGLPTEEVVVNGKKFRFVGRFHKLSASWHELVRQSDLEDNPIRVASLSYLEKGSTYAETDKNGNIKYPTSDRDTLFTTHFPLDEYLRLKDFFLLKYSVSFVSSKQCKQGKTLEMTTWEELQKMMKESSRIYGRLRSNTSQTSTESHGIQ